MEDGSKVAKSNWHLIIVTARLLSLVRKQQGVVVPQDGVGDLGWLSPSFKAKVTSKSFLVPDFAETEELIVRKQLVRHLWHLCVATFVSGVVCPFGFAVQKLGFLIGFWISNGEPLCDIATKEHINSGKAFEFTAAMLLTFLFSLWGIFLFKHKYKLPKRLWATLAFIIGSILWGILLITMPYSGISDLAITFLVFWAGLFIPELLSRSLTWKGSFQIFLVSMVLLLFPFSMQAYLVLSTRLEDPFASIAITGVGFPLMQILLRRILMFITESTTRKYCETDEAKIKEAVGVTSVAMQFALSTPGFVVLFLMPNHIHFFLVVSMSFATEILGTVIHSHVFKVVTSQKITIGITVCPKFLASKLAHEGFGEKAAAISAALILWNVNQLTSYMGIRITFLCIMEMYADLAKDVIWNQKSVYLHQVRYQFSISSILLVSCFIVSTEIIISAGMVLECYL